MKPKVSVVTVNYNMRDDLRETIASVLQQDYDALEYIVIDGGSDDGSRGVIEEFSGRIDHWVSEPDRSLYDGMNKGVRLASGDWIIFLNSGDRLCDTHTIRDIFSEPSIADADLVYGHAEWFYPREQLSRLIPAEPLEVLSFRMNCSHQALFARREILVEHPLSMNRFAADYEFLVTSKLAGYRFKIIDRLVSRCKAGGRSDVQRMRSLVDRYRILREKGLMTPRLALAYAIFAVQGLGGKFLRQILPAPVAGRLLAWKHRARASRMP